METHESRSYASQAWCGCGNSGERARSSHGVGSYDKRVSYPHFRFHVSALGPVLYACTHKACLGRQSVLYSIKLHAYPFNTAQYWALQPQKKLKNPTRVWTSLFPAFPQLDVSTDSISRRLSFGCLLCSSWPRPPLVVRPTAEDST